MNFKIFIIFTYLACTINLNAQHFSVMTYNIRCGNCDETNSNNWNSRKEMLLSVIKNNNADLIGFQEMVPKQLVFLKINLPGYFCFGTGRDADGNGEGCYIFYKKNMFILDSLHSGTKWFSSTPDIPGSNDMGDNFNRIITWARFKCIATNQCFYHFNTHLTYIDSIQVRYIDFLSQVIKNRTYKDPFIVSGDFNAIETSPAILKLKQNFSTSLLVDSYREIYPNGSISTFNNFTHQSNGEKIDYIFMEGTKFTSEKAGCDSTMVNGKNPSDHNAIYAEIEFKKIK